jgi:hypothetical protein
MTEFSSTSLEFRKEYRQGSLEESSINTNPIAQLRTWLEQATQAGVIEPNAMTVSSVGANGRPSSRVVLLRNLEDSGLTFFTNYTSRKGQEFDAHGFACVNFWWGSLAASRARNPMRTSTPGPTNHNWQVRPARKVKPRLEPISRLWLKPCGSSILKAYRAPRIGADFGLCQIVLNSGKADPHAFMTGLCTCSRVKFGSCSGSHRKPQMCCASMNLEPATGMVFP